MLNNNLPAHLGAGLCAFCVGKVACAARAHGPLRYDERIAAADPVCPGSGGRQWPVVRSRRERVEQQRQHTW